MAIVRLKNFIQDVKDGKADITADTSVYATSAGNSGTALLASTATFATSAGQAGTARVAHYGSSGTGGLAGT